jgi:hypothetical protein
VLEAVAVIQKKLYQIAVKVGGLRFVAFFLEFRLKAGDP